MTETDLVTADDSTENHKLSNSVTTDSSADHDASGSATEANTSGSDGSLSTMVLPELRALANRAGVKGASGMRKNELIAAIRESREGHSNGAPANGGESHNHTSEAPANHTEATADDATRADASEGGSSGDRAERQNRDEKTDQSADKPSRNGCSVAIASWCISFISFSPCAVRNRELRRRSLEDRPRIASPRVSRSSTMVTIADLSRLPIRDSSTCE